MNGNQRIERRFLFHGSALGVAAHIRRPNDYFLDSVASSTLAITGGRTEAYVEAGGAGIISFRSAATRAYGDFMPPEEVVRFTYGNHGDNNLPTRTVVQARVSGFKIEVPQVDEDRHPDLAVRTVFIEEMDALLESTSDRWTPNAFRTLTASIRGVVVDGRELIVETDTRLFTEKCTKKKLDCALDCALDDEDFRQRCSNQITYDDRVLTLGTVVTGLRWADGPAIDTKLENNRLTILGLGSLYFGEIIIQEGFRRLTLVRFQLGSPDGGCGVSGQVESNGQTYPPQKSGL